MVNIDRNGYSDLLMRRSCARFARSSSARLQSELLSRLPGLRIHRVAVVLADALDEEEPARPVAVALARRAHGGGSRGVERPASHRYTVTLPETKRPARGGPKPSFEDC